MADIATEDDDVKKKQDGDRQRTGVFYPASSKVQETGSEPLTQPSREEVAGTSMREGAVASTCMVDYEEDAFQRRWDVAEEEQLLAKDMDLDYSGMGFDSRDLLSDSDSLEYTVLESPDHGIVLIIYSHGNRGFVISKMIEELKKGSGLQLIHAHHPGDPSSIKPNSVIVYLNETTLEREIFLDGKIKFYDKQQIHTLVIASDENYNEPFVYWHRYRNLMLYPSLETKLRPHFWNTMISLIAHSEMDPDQLALLNDFGLVRHTVLKSQDHSFVHVICSHHSKDFVRTELIEGLKTRCGLQLVPSLLLIDQLPVKPKTVICFHDRGLTETALEEAVKTYHQPETHIVFLQCTDQYPHWISDLCEKCSLMLYPESEEERLPHFWDTLTLMIGRPEMDHYHRALLNDFGPVKHIVLGSDDHRFVHVIYCQHARDFVHTQLIEELKLRSKLQLIPVLPVTDLPSVKPRIAICVLDGFGTFLKVLEQSLKTYNEQETNIIFLQKDSIVPLLEHSLYGDCSLMLYPGSKGERMSQFWDMLTLMIAYPEMDHKNHAVLNNFGVVQHTILESSKHVFVQVIYTHHARSFIHTELIEELKTHCGLQLVPSLRLIDQLPVRPKTVICFHDGVGSCLTETVLEEAIKTYHQPETHIVFLRCTDQYPDWMLDLCGECSLMLYPGSEEERLPHFWDTLTLMIAHPDMHPSRHAFLNNFGVFQHALLELPECKFVHVIYGHHSKDFVHTELIEELKSRSKLQLVPAHRLVDLPSVILKTVIIILKKFISGVERKVLEQILKAQEQQKILTMFLLRSEDYSDSIFDWVPRQWLMIHPGSQEAVLPQFWDNLISLIASPDMNRDQHALLNDFGMVQHAVLELSDHRFASVIFSYYSRDFVQTEVTEELKKRGLHLVPVNRLVSLLPIKPTTTIIILDGLHIWWHTIFEQTVKAFDQPEKHTILLQRSENYPLWIVDWVRHPSLVLYPSSEKRCPPQFWDTLTALVDYPYMDTDHIAFLNDFSPVQHIMCEMPDHRFVLIIYSLYNKKFVHTELIEDLKVCSGLQVVSLPAHLLIEELKTCSGLQVVNVPAHHPADQVPVKPRTVIVILDKFHTMQEQQLLKWTVKAYDHPQTHTVFLQGSENYPSWTIDWLQHPSLILCPSSEEKCPSQFWDTLICLIAYPEMDPYHRALLNDFGLIQHTVFESPDHKFVHVTYSHRSRDFATTELSDLLKTRSGLQLVPKHHLVDLPSIKPETLLIILEESNTWNEDRIFERTVKAYDQLHIHTVFLLRSENYSKWVIDRIPSSNVIKYPSSEEQCPPRFWDTLISLIDHPDRNHRHHALLNDFDLVERTVLASQGDNFVHVIYNHNTSDFVHNELIVELKARSGPELVPAHRMEELLPVRVKTTIIIPDNFITWRERIILEKTVQAYNQPETHTVILQKREGLSERIRDLCKDCSMMLYPGSEKKLLPGFWDSLTSLIAHPDLDPYHRDLLNAFGPNPCTVLESPDHQLVHVIYTDSERNFVHSRLIEELMKRTGLQVVPTHSLVDLPSVRSKTSIVILPKTETTVEEMTLKRSMETINDPETHTVFVLMGGEHSKWSLKDQQYPKSREISYSGSLFWDRLISLAEISKISEGDENDTWKEKEKTESQLQVHKGLPESDSSTSQQSAAESWEDVNGAAFNTKLTRSGKEAVGSAKAKPENTEQGMAASMITSSTESDVESQTSDDFVVVNSHDEEGGSCRSHCSFCSTASSPSPTSSLEHMEQSDKPDENNDEIANIDNLCLTAHSHFNIPPPIVAEKWQVSHTFNKEGGCLRLSNSDVILRVPDNAVLNSPVEVRAAVCADVAHIRDVLKMSDDEEVVSPLAEYWAGADFHFSRPVTVELPHCLSADYNPELVHVYHVSCNQQGIVSLRKLKHETDAMHCNSGEVTNTADQHSDESTELPSNEEDVLFVRPVAATDFKQQKSSKNATEAKGSFMISPHGVVTILINSFCGYVCAECKGKEKKRPQLYTMGSVIPSEELFHVSAYVWDRRLKVKDFREIYRMEQGDNIEPLLLLDDVASSKLHMRLILPESSGISHVKAESGSPIFPVFKAYDIPSLLSCERCIKKGKIVPLSKKWKLKPRDNHALPPDLVLAAEISHVAGHGPPSWEDRDRMEKLTTVEIQEMVNPHKKQWTSQLKALSTTHLAVIAKNLGICMPNPAQCSSEVDYREQLTTSIICEGPSRFIPVLANFLAQVPLRHGHELPDASSTHLKTVIRTNTRERSCDEIVPQNGSQAAGFRETASSVSQHNLIQASCSQSTLPPYSIGEPSTVRCTSKPAIYTMNHDSDFSSAFSSTASKQKITESSLTQNDALAEAQTVLEDAPTICHDTFSTLSLSDYHFYWPESENGNADHGT